VCAPHTLAHTSRAEDRTLYFEDESPEAVIDCLLIVARKD
jgi:hypothetical protein